MKTTSRNTARPGRTVVTLLALGALLSTASCVSQKKYDEAVKSAKLYQRSYHDLEQYQGQLESENQELRGELELLEGVPTEASYSADIDLRMQEVQRLLGQLGKAPDDVTMLEFEGGYGYSLKNSVLFDSGSAEISDEGRQLLTQMGEEITSRPFHRIWVRGHTDSDPVRRPATRERFPHGNLQLSASRAVEVAALMVREANLDETRVYVAGFGPNLPVAANDKAENKAMNRRVEIVVYEEDLSSDGSFK